MRLAGELIHSYLRESKLATNRSQPIGSGGYGVVYESDVPGNVMKQSHQPDGLFPGAQTSLTDEANMQAVAAEMGIAPRIAGIETFPGGIGNRIEMQDVRDNFEMPPVSSQWPTGKNAVRVNQQLGQLALKGIDLDDRHAGNIVYNKMTGRPLQLDFGKSRTVTGEDQVAALTNATEAGFAAAGLGDVAQIYSATVYDLLAGGQVADAMVVAKQGFSRLQKL
jgi:hypothetical protein